MPKASKRRERTEQDDVRLTVQSVVSALRLTRCRDGQIQAALQSLEHWLSWNTDHKEES